MSTTVQQTGLRDTGLLLGNRTITVASNKASGNRALSKGRHSVTPSLELYKAESHPELILEGLGAKTIV